MAADANNTWSFCGRRFSRAEQAFIREVVRDCSGLSHMELGHTVAELVAWRRPNGALKARECREFIEHLEQAGELTLPAKRPGRPVGSRTAVPRTSFGDEGAARVGSVEDFAPILLEPVRSPEEHCSFRELVGRHHYLGYRVPFGAHVKYLVWGSRPERAPLGCLQFSSAAWRMAVRDRWIAWDDLTRKKNLSHVVSNSRFLILPWVRIVNLASHVLGLAARRLSEDWTERYAVEPWLAETLVDPARFHGGCYRAANWVALGTTTGRGRMDREHLRHGAEPKTVFVYPLVRDALARLREGSGMAA
jgi:Domain of unknown function (DUF4338)